MPVRTIFNDPIPQSSTFRYTAQLQDETGVAIPWTSLTTFTLTVYRLSDQALINGIDHVNVLNVGRGTVDLQGNVTITLAPADNVIPSSTTEAHIMLLEWTYASGAKEGIHEVQFTVGSITRV